jgi:hypothetical protein
MSQQIISILNPLCRGLVGYISFLATCKASTAYTEYLLYEPILRIARAQGWDVSCEVPVISSASGKGDKKRIDFVLTRGKTRLALEVKWVGKKCPNLQNDTDKLREYSRSKTSTKGYVLLFGRTELIKQMRPITDCAPKSKTRAITWRSGKTNYSAICLRYT